MATYDDLPKITIATGPGQVLKYNFWHLKIYYLRVEDYVGSVEWHERQKDWELLKLTKGDNYVKVECFVSSIVRHVKR